MVLPIYFVAKLLGKEPTHSIVIAVNLTQHFLIGLFVAFTMFTFLSSLNVDRLSSVLLSVLSGGYIYFMPQLMYWFSVQYTWETAIILPSILIILCEVLRDTCAQTRRKVIEFAQSLLLFWASLVFCSSLLLSAIVYLKRILTFEFSGGHKRFLKKTALFWLPQCLGWGLFLIQVHSVHRVKGLLERGLFRSGFGLGGGTGASHHFQKFWHTYISLAYGRLGEYLLLLSSAIYLAVLFYVLLRTRKGTHEISPPSKQLLGLIGIIIVPSLLYVYLLQNSAGTHPSSTLHFCVPLATVPLILLPILIFSVFGKNISDHRLGKCAVIPLLLFLIGVIHIRCEYHNYERFFLQSPRDPMAEGVGTSIHKHAKFRDVVFSSDIEIKPYPPYLMSYAMKRVYRVDSMEQVRMKMETIEDGKMLFVFQNEPSPYWRSELRFFSSQVGDRLFYFREREGRSVGGLSLNLPRDR